MSTSTKVVYPTVAITATKGREILRGNVYTLSLRGSSEAEHGLARYEGARPATTLAHMNHAGARALLFGTSGSTTKCVIFNTLKLRLKFMHHNCTSTATPICNNESKEGRKGK